MEPDKRTKELFFSICIPQYNRTSFLLESLKVLKDQTFRDFEVCISDDRSPDGRQKEIMDYLEASGLEYRFIIQERNLRYDGNLRASIALAQGRYCFLLGNDDCLVSPETLERLFLQLKDRKNIGVVVTNFEDWANGQIGRRIRKGGVFGSGPEVAAVHYRDVAFVSGIILNREQAQSHATRAWDGSEMYQMFLMARIVAAGADLLGVEESTIRKDIRVPGETVDSYALRPRIAPCPIKERVLPFCRIGRLVADAVLPYTPEEKKAEISEKIVLQLYVFTYPYWILEYRRIQSWRFALGLCLGIRPKNVFLGLPLGRFREWKLMGAYLAISMGSLITPLLVFDKLRPALYAAAKGLFARPARIAT
jgi:glycosyltransferase involved in cell wall biosynthesis